MRRFRFFLLAIPCAVSCVLNPIPGLPWSDDEELDPQSDNAAGDPPPDREGEGGQGGDSSDSGGGQGGQH